MFKVKGLLNKFSTFFLFEILNKVFPFILLPIIASNISVSQYGELGLFNSLAYFFIVLISLNHYTFLSKEYYRIDINGNKLLYNLIIQNLLSGLTISIVVLGGNFLFGNVFSLLIVVYALLAATLASLVSLISTFFVTIKKPVLYGVLSIVPNLILFCVAYVLIEIFNCNYHGRILAQIIGGIFGLAIGLVILNDIIREYYGTVDFKIIARSIKWTLPLLPHTLAFWAKSGLDTIVISKFLGKEYAGLFSMILVYTSLWMILVNSLFNVITPEFNSRMHSGSINYFKYKCFGIWFSVFIFILLVLYYFVSVFFTEIMLPKDYQKSLDYLPLILPAMFANSIYAYLSLAFFFQDRTKLIAKVSVLTSIIHSTLVLLFSKYLSFEIVLIVPAVSSVMMMCILLINLKESTFYGKIG